MSTDSRPASSAAGASFQSDSSSGGGGTRSGGGGGASTSGSISATAVAPEDSSEPRLSRGFSATATKFDSTERPAASDEAAVWARSMAGSALLGLLDEQAATRSAYAWCSSSAVLCRGARLSRKARETASSRACSMDRWRSFNEFPTFSDYGNARKGCQLTFRKRVPARAEAG